MKKVTKKQTVQNAALQNKLDRLLNIIGRLKASGDKKIVRELRFASHFTSASKRFLSIVRAYMRRHRRTKLLVDTVKLSLRLAEKEIRQVERRHPEFAAVVAFELLTQQAETLEHQGRKPLPFYVESPADTDLRMKSHPRQCGFRPDPPKPNDPNTTR